jgi:hypothetical protein
MPDARLMHSSAKKRFFYLADIRKIGIEADSDAMRLTTLRGSKRWLLIRMQFESNHNSKKDKTADRIVLSNTRLGSLLIFGD